MSEDFQIGFTEEQEHFCERNRLFVERFPRLEVAMKTAFRESRSADPLDRIVFFSGRLCVEDFNEIFLLAANGYGVGAQKILRGMYERAVIARYLHLHPEEADAFEDFYWVSQHRLIEAIRRTFGDRALRRKQIEETQRNYRRVRDQFLVTDCGTCNTKRLNYTWSKLDFVTMAGRVGTLGQLIVPAYYFPTREAHGTAAALISRVKKSEAGGMEFDAGPQREWADLALSTAHSVLLDVLDLQKEHFKFEPLQEPLQVCVEDFKEICQQAKREG